MMSGFSILDLVVGMIFIFFLLSIICSSVVEIVVTLLKVRSKLLSAWLFEIFNNELGHRIMNHPSVTGLTKKNAAPDYIDAKNFSTALLDIITSDTKYDPVGLSTDLQAYVDLIKKAEILDEPLKKLLVLYANEAQMNLDKKVNNISVFKQKIENWYDTSMDRVSGNFKKKYARPVTFLVALVSVLLLNADSIAFAKFLYANPAAREKMADAGTKATGDSIWKKRIETIEAAQTTSDSTKKSIAAVKKEIQEKVAEINTARKLMDSTIPIGWKENELYTVFHSSLSVVVSKICGLMMTVMAVLMGAPFWFDILNKISNLRATGKKPEKSTP